MPVILSTVSLTSGSLGTHLLFYENFLRKWKSDSLLAGERVRPQRPVTQRRSAGVWTVEGQDSRVRGKQGLEEQLTPEQRNYRQLL